MRIIYTAAARQELHDFERRQQKLLEEILLRQKFVFGDSSVEVIASDIRNAERLIRIDPSGRSGWLSIIAWLYMVLGLSVTMGALLYPHFMSVYIENQFRGNLIILGLLTAFAGLFASRYLKFRSSELCKK